MMANSIHNLSTPSCQEALNLMYIEKTIPACYSLSKSSSALPCSSLGGSHAKPEMYKSLNSIPCVPKCNENSIQHSHNSSLSSTQDTAAEPCPVTTSCNRLSVEKAEEKTQKNHYLSADSSLATTEPEITRSFVRYNVSENISLLGRSDMSIYEAESLENLDTPSVMVQKSYSDYCCGRRNSVPRSVKVHNKTSATYSNLSSSSSISGSSSDRTCNLSNVTQDSGIVHSPSNLQNNLTDATSPDKDHNIPLCHLDSSSIQHNITVYAVPGTYQHGILGPRNSGNGFPNNGHVYSQSNYNIPGVMSSDNISELHTQALIIHNSCSVHCCRSHEPMIKADDTIAAYCHSMPIPSVHLSAGLGHSVADPGSLNAQSQLCSQGTLSDKFAFPKLVSSISESGMDARKLIRCGHFTFPQPLISDEGLHLGGSVKENDDLLLKTMDNSQDELKCTSYTKMKDNWTMTSMNYFSPEQRLPLSCKDAEVQTVIIMENKSVSTIPCLQTTGKSLLHPEVGLGFNLQCPQTPVREVRWDDEGMTWEVYGAAVDPEVLGLAIQKHLEIQIEQHTQPSELSGDIEQPVKGKRRSFRTVIQSLRQSKCCVRTNSASE